MSKPIARVVFSTLIALALIVGIYTTVLAGARSGQAHIAAGAKQALQRTSAQEFHGLDAQSDTYDGPKHDCGDPSWTDPADD